MSKTKKQTELILEYLKQGNSLTVLTAIFEPFRCYALSQRCGELRRAGHPVVSKFVELPNGKRVKSYSLAS